MTNFNIVKGAQTLSSDFQSTEASVVLENDSQRLINPYKVWVEELFYAGNLPPEVQYYERNVYGQRYRGWLTRTRRTDGVWFVVYEGYIFRPDVNLPIPAAAPVEVDK